MYMDENLEFVCVCMCLSMLFIPLHYMHFMFCGVNNVNVCNYDY